MNLNPHVTWIAACLLAASCSRDHEQQREPESAATEGAESAAESGPASESDDPLEQAKIDVSDWQSWKKVNTQRFFSKAHMKMWVDIYLPADQADTYVNGRPPTEGMKIVKAQYPSETAEDAKSITLMVRQNDSWFWGMYAPNGTMAMKQGQIDSCIDCHSMAGSDQLYRHLSASD